MYFSPFCLCTILPHQLFKDEFYYTHFKWNAPHFTINPSEYTLVGLGFLLLYCVSGTPSLSAIKESTLNQGPLILNTVSTLPSFSVAEAPPQLYSVSS